MPIPDDPYYCSEQIQIPPEFPDILKQFTKAAIRTQPKDVLAWSAAYFKALAQGNTPPVKDRLEMPIATQKTDTGLTPGILRILHKQLGPKINVTMDQIEEKWKELSLPMEKFQEIARIGNFTGEIEWIHFHALAASHLVENLTQAMELLCQLLTADPEGGACRIGFELWTKLYKYLVGIDGSISNEHIDQVLAYVAYDVERNEGMMQPRIFLHPDCPRLH